MNVLFIMKEITEIFTSLINQFGSLEIAEAEFKRMDAEDPELHAAYVEWCHENGSSLRNGFSDFCDEYIESHNSVWESLTDYDEE